MDETQLQELFDRYRYSENAQEQETCVKDVSVLVYGYSRRNFPYDQDLGSDFFLEIYPKISQIFDNYDPQKGMSFKSYLALRLSYLSKTFFTKQKNKSRFMSFSPIENYLFDVNLHSIFSDDSGDEQYNKMFLLELSRKTFAALDSLPNEIQVLVKLHYGIPMSLANFRYVTKEKELSNFIADFRKLKKILLQRKEEHSRIKSKHKAKLLRYNLLSQYHPTDGENFSKRYDALVKKKLTNLELIRYRELAWLMHTPVSTIYRKINVGERILREKLKEEVS